MKRTRCPAFTLSAAVLISSLSGCALPTFDPGKILAIAAEADLIAVRYPANPVKGWTEVPKSQWPTAIASLEPYRVISHRWGIDVAVKPYFDGGWGYHISRERSHLPMPAGCYWECGKTVYWHGPC